MNITDTTGLPSNHNLQGNNWSTHCAKRLVEAADLNMLTELYS